MMEINEGMVERLARRFRALADPVRIRLLLTLREGERSVTDLAQAVGCQQASTSKHLSVLRQDGLVRVRRAGNQAFYSVLDPELYNLCSLVCDGVRRVIEAERSALAL